MLTLEKQSTLTPLSKSIYLLLTLFASPFSIRITGVNRIKFDSGAYFCLNDFRSLTALNISRAAASNVLVVPTWRTNLSRFFFLKIFLSSIAPWNFRIFIDCRLDILLRKHFNVVLALLLHWYHVAMFDNVNSTLKQCCVHQRLNLQC